MDIKPPQTIRRKLLRSSLTVLAVSQAGLLAAMLWILTSLAVRQRDNTVAEIRSELMEKGRNLIADHSLVLPRMAEDNAFRAVADLVSTTVARNPDVVYGVFMDAGRQPWVMANSDNPGGQIKEPRSLDDSASLWAAGLTGENHKTLIHGGVEILEFAAPILVDGEKVGTIRYGLSTARMNQAISDAARLSRQALIRTLVAVLFLSLLSASLAFLVSQRFATRLTRPIEGLQRAANAIAGGNYHQEVELSGTDEIALLAADFDVMRRKVKEYTERLHEMVEEKVREIRDILDNIGQGLFTVDYGGRVNPDYAATTNAILGVEDVARTSMAELFRLDKTGLREWMEWLELTRMRQGKMKWKQILRLCPLAELALPGELGKTRYVQIGFQPMLDRQGKPVKLMVLVQDVTETRRIEALMRAEKENHEDEVRAILGIVNNATLVPEFLRDVETKETRLLSLCRKWGAEQPPAEELAEVLRDLHTLKGSASTYGFVALERAARKAELVAVAMRSHPAAVPDGSGDSAATPNRTGELLEILERELRPAIVSGKSLARRLSGLGDEPSLPIPERKIRSLQSLAGLVSERESILRDRLEELLCACRTLDHVRFSVPGQRYRAMLSRLAGRLGKTVHLQVSPEALEISPRILAALDEPLVHLLRNALDHGVETRDERIAAGKPEAGSIQLSLERDQGGLTVRIEDDGKGIDTAKVTERAIALGAIQAERVAAMTEAEKTGLILLPGLTTRDQRGELSGLGVGMDAVATWATSLGGAVDISTLKGRGTRITLRLPADFES